MDRIKSVLLAIVFLGSVSVSCASFAGNTLNGDDLKKLIVGNTIYGEFTSNGKKFKNYFDANGKSYRDVGGKVSEGSYNISSEGKHCVKFDTPENCSMIESNADGSYNRVAEDGKVIVKWLKIVTGKDLN